MNQTDGSLQINPAPDPTQRVAASARPQRYCCRAIGRSDDVDVVRLRPLLALAGLEGDSLALLQ